MIPSTPQPGGAPALPARPDPDTKLREVAKALEAQFVAEMLKHTGLGETRGAFTGGPGEAQFASFLREAQAKEMVEAGGIGLAESLFEALKERMNDAS